MDNVLTFRVEGLYKSFGEKPILKGIDLKVETAKTTVILGPSGSGKSVLLKHLNGLLRPDRGKIFFHDMDITALSKKELLKIRLKIGMVFQHATLFDSMTVFENIALPLYEHSKLSREEIKSRVLKILKDLDLEGTEYLYPADLSGGMQKRVSLARSVILSPGVLLYDEPTTGLDPLTTQTISDMIRNAKNRFNVTQVVITHDIGLAFEIGDYIYIINNGKIVERGLPGQIKESSSEFTKRFLSTWQRRSV